MGVPVLTGWAVGDITAGLLATIGAFTALYGNDRPFLNRAVHLAVIAVAFALAVSLGVWAAEMPLMVVPTVVMIAMAATFLCNALRVAPPGAYMFVLACAAGTGMPTGHLAVPQIALLVLAGGSFAWLAHMTGALVSSRGPERIAVVTAANAIARFVGAVGSPDEDGLRHSAALAMHESWTTLVTHQPSSPRPNGTLSRLRAINRELNRLFVSTVNAATTPNPSLPGFAKRARELAAEAMDAESGAEQTDPGHVPLGHHGFLESLREGLRPWSPPLLVAARVGGATAVAGVIGAALGLERAYWIMAAAVLMLHQGLDWARSLQRGIERMTGTLIGLILAGAILAIDPQGLWLVLTLMLLQFSIEMTVIRSYALAVVFITAAALTIASGGHPVPDVGHLLWVRGVDTFIGCTIGLVVLAMTTPRTVAVRISQELIATLAAVRTALDLAAKGESASGAAREARRDLQHRTILLLQAYDTSIGAAPWHRATAELSWPAVVAMQRLAYRVLSTCWALENAGTEAAPEMARTLFGPDGAREVNLALEILSSAIHAETKPPPLAHVPGFLSAEIQNLHDSLVPAGSRTAGWS
ncbi:MAG: FUSC family protein [Hyphomicrobiaceae bacterium]